MDAVHPSELPHSMSMLPGYSGVALERRAWIIVSVQLAFCIFSSVYLFILVYRRFYKPGEKSWRATVELLIPISNRVRNLEKERLIWDSYLEWIEDYCAVYYGLLNYLNTAVADLDKMYRDPDLYLDYESECSCSTAGDGQLEGVLSSGVSCEEIASNEEMDLAAKITNVLAGAKLSNKRKTGNDVKRDDVDSLSVFSLGTNDQSESLRDELESLKETSEEEGLLELKMTA